MANGEMLPIVRMAKEHSNEEQSRICTLDSSLLQPSSDNFEISTQHNVDRFRVGNVLLLQNARGEGVLIVAVKHRDSLLHDDRSVIEFFVNEMHGASGNLYSIGECLLLRFEAGKCWQQRRMDIENPLRKLLHEPGREQAHVSREANQIHIVLLEHGDDFAFVLFSRPALRRNHQSSQAALPCGSDARSIRIIGDDDG